MSLSGTQQRRLWELASARPMPRGQLLPAGTEEAVFAGRNSLRALTRFQKCFGKQGSATIGYNRHSLGRLIGPGYFTVLAEDGGLLRFDYDTLPAAGLPGWPPVASNQGLFAGQVYGHLSDRVAWVSTDVLVGSAYRSGKDLDSYFVLARTNPQAEEGRDQR